MADEIAQVCELEMQGVKMVFKATLEVATFVMRAMKAFINASGDLWDKYKTFKLEKKGKKTFKELLELCNGGPPQALNIREEDFEEVLRLAEKNGLHYTITTDFNPNDGMVPLLITPQEAPAWGQTYKAVAAQRLDEDKKSVSGYDRLIAEEKEKLLNEKEPSQIAKIQVKIENLEQAKQESSKWVDYGEDVLNKDDVSISFQDYLKEAKGTDFERSPELAIAENEKGVEIGHSFSAKESFQPIRDKSLMPETKLMFYVPKLGAVVTREFHQEEQTGLVYSDYAVKTKEGEIFRCSDKDTTKEKWNDSILPKLLDKAGMLEGTECRAFNNEEKLKSYLAYHNKIASPAQKNIQKALDEDREVFSNAEAKNEVLNAVSERSKGFASANVTDTGYEIICDFNRLVRDKGKLKMTLSEDECIVFSRTVDEGIDKNGMAKFTINEESNAIFIKTKDRTVTQIAITPVEVELKVKEMLGENIANMVQKGTQHKGR